MNILFQPKVLEALREFIAQGWDEKTGHPFCPNRGKQRPDGQGYPTSRVLRDAYGGVVVRGTIGDSTHEHCWLEKSIDDTAMVVDLTSDQAGIGRIFAARTYKELPDYHRIDEITDEEARQKETGEFARYLLLKQRLKDLISR